MERWSANIGVVVQPVKQKFFPHHKIFMHNRFVDLSTSGHSTALPF
jgi:hypothetical protein